LAALGLAAGLAGGAALAQTASGPPSAPIAPQKATEARDDDIDAQIAAYTAAPAAPQGPTGSDEAAPPRQIHGEVGAAMGSNGYREAYVTSEIPLGSDGALGVAVDEAAVKLRNGPTLRRQSLAVSLDLGQPANAPGCVPVPESAGPSEPLWATRLRGAPAPACMIAP
jgi:hypothetical protein